MKTQILQLDPHDDAISTGDKMIWSQTTRILLVWPGRGQVLRRYLDLVLLLRRSQTMGAQLALVTRDPVVRYHAGQLGIPVFKNVHQAREAHWRQPKRRAPQPLQYRSRPPAPQRARTPNGPLTVRLSFFSLGSLAVLALIAVLLPSARITLTPETSEQEIILAVQANAATERVNLSGIVPLHTTSVTVGARDSLATSGTTSLPDRAAAGRVQFTNLTGRPVTAPAGTVVTTRNATVRFATTRAGQAPAGPGERVTLPVIALTPGSAGNLPAESIQAIEGQLGVALAVTNLEPTTGGSEISSPAPTQLDRTRLQARLLQSLKETALDEIRLSLAPGDLLLSSAPMQVHKIEATYDPPGSEPASELFLSLRLEVETQIVLAEDLYTLASAILEANLPQGYSALPETLKVDHLSEPVMVTDSSARWNLRARRAIQAQLEEMEAVQIALGLAVPEAEQRLAASLRLEGTPQVTLAPAWWPRLPIFPFRVTVQNQGIWE